MNENTRIKTLAAATAHAWDAFAIRLARPAMRTRPAGSAERLIPLGRVGGAADPADQVRGAGPRVVRHGLRQRDALA